MSHAQLEKRLRNYGYWLMHDSAIGPDKPKCRGPESRHLQEAGDVWEASYSLPTPDVSDAEALHRAIRTLDCMEQYCLIARIMQMIGYDSEYPAVFRMRRVGEHAMQKMADNAEAMLLEMLRKRA